MPKYVDGYVLPVPKKNGDTDSQCGHLRQRKVNKNDFPPHDVQTVIDQNSWQQQARDERP